MENSNFFAMISRMKYIGRWGLMRNTRQENLAEHSLEVAVISHALAVIGNTMLSKNLDEGQIVIMAIYHDASEIITGDLPTPIKYRNQDIKDAYKSVEHDAAKRMLSELPEIMTSKYSLAFDVSQQNAYLKLLVHAADKISALIKCIEEEKAGNSEFVHAKQAQLNALKNLKLEEVDIFLERFMDGFYLTLDELQGR